jgi:hypothetical protein
MRDLEVEYGRKKAVQEQLGDDSALDELFLEFERFQVSLKNECALLQSFGIDGSSL